MCGFWLLFLFSIGAACRSNGVDFHSQLNTKPWGMWSKARSAVKQQWNLLRITHSCELQRMYCLGKEINGRIISCFLQWRDYHWCFFLFALKTSNTFWHVIYTVYKLFLGRFWSYEIHSEAMWFYNFTTDFLLKMTEANLPITPFDFNSTRFCALRGIHNKLKKLRLLC